MRQIRERLTYANVVATLALFIALGGSSYAAITITGKSVKDSSLTGRDVKNSSLTSSDIRDRSLLSKDFKAGQLPAGARGAQGPQGPQGAAGPQGPQGPAGAGVAAPEAFHLVGGSGEPTFLNGWTAVGGSSAPGFYKDPLGIVHLRGAVQGGTANNGATGNIFVLPEGYRPAANQQFTGGDATGTGQIAVLPTGDVRALNGAGVVLLTLDGFTFRAGA